MTVAELLALVETLPPEAPVSLETDTLKLLDLTGARLDLSPSGPGRLVLEGVEP